jgi:hypothetical protein
MKRRHAIVIALLIGAAALAGLVAATRTAGLGRSAQQPAISTASIAARNRALDRTEANLRRILAQRPAANRAVPAAPAQKVVYVRPAPKVVTIHRANGGEREADGAEPEGGFDD